MEWTGYSEYIWTVCKKCRWRASSRCKRMHKDGLEGCVELERGYSCKREFEPVVLKPNNQKNWPHTIPTVPATITCHSFCALRSISNSHCAISVLSLASKASLVMVFALAVYSWASAITLTFARLCLGVHYPFYSPLVLKRALRWDIHDWCNQQCFR